MQVTIDTIRNFLDKQQHHVSHYLVAHTHYKAYHKSATDIERMTFNLRKDLLHARNCFNKELYGNGARRKPQLLRPLLIPTMEGTKEIENPQKTIHYNIYLGNLPTILNRYQYLRHFPTSLGTALQILPEKVHCCNYGV